MPAEAPFCQLFWRAYILKFYLSFKETPIVSDLPKLHPSLQLDLVVSPYHFLSLHHVVLENHHNQPNEDVIYKQFFQTAE